MAINNFRFDRRAANRSRNCSGFSYIGLLVIIAVLAVVAAGTVQTGAVVQRRDAEDEEIAVGLEFKTAVRSYFEATPSGMPSSAPRSLQDLLRDPRFPNPKRYLRKIYNDPLTGKPDWGLIHSPEGGILGVYSKAQGVPIRQDNFPDELFFFKNKKTYRGWVFVYGVVCTEAGCDLPNHEEQQEMQQQ